MKVVNCFAVALSAGTLCLATPAAHADLTNHAAAGTNSFDVLDSDDKFAGSSSQGGGVWEIGNLGTYAASIARTGTSTEQTFSGSAQVDGADSVGVLKAVSQVEDTGSGWKVGVNSRAVWQDTLYLDDAAANFGDDLTVVVGASAALSAVSENTQQTQARVFVRGGEPGFSGINGSFPAPNGQVIADAEDRPFSSDDGWDGDLFPHWATTPQDAGWETFVSSTTRNTDAESFSASFEGTTAFSVDHAGMEDGKHVYEFKVVLDAYGYTEEGSVTTNAGSSVDILGFRDAGGDTLDPSLYSFESGMTMVPEPASIAMLGVGGLALFRRRR